MGFSRQKYWIGLPFPSPGDLSHPGFETVSLVFPALAGGFFTTSTTWKAPTVDPKSNKTDVLMRKDSDRGEDKGHVMSDAETTALQLETKEHKGRLVNTRG